MRKLRELLRLKLCAGLSNRQIGRALNVAASTVGYYVSAAAQAQLTWESINGLNDSRLIKALEPYCQQLKPSRPTKEPINLLAVHQQLQRKGVTRELLWEEYQTSARLRPYSYTEFCRQYREFTKTLKPTMRQQHIAGEKAFVDYAGPRVPIIHPITGGVQHAVIFVGVLGASHYTYAEATLTRRLPDWLQSHVRMYEFFGGVPALTIPDNEKAGVKAACYYDPELNPQYAALAMHYNTVVLPTRPGKPRDKAKVESAVLLVERWILARLRHYTFFSLQELNQAIRQLLIELNERPFKKLPGSRRSHFEAQEKTALKPLPALRYEYVDIKKTQVRLDYHVEVEQHYYSVPYQYIGKTVCYQLSSHTLEIFYQGERIASHQRSTHVGSSTTTKAHMPHAHRRHQQWSPQRFIEWANSIGNETRVTAQHIIESQPHPECCYRIHLGLRHLAKRYGRHRLESACHYALEHAVPTFKSIRSILQTHIDQLPVSALVHANPTTPIATHDYIRGANYYSL